MKNQNALLIGVVILLLMGNLFFGYMFFFQKNQFGSGTRGDFPQMQLTDKQISDVTAFFESTSNTEDIASYCENNRMGCFYYCREINSNHDYCSQLMQNMPDSSGPGSQQAQKLN